MNNKKWLKTLLITSTIIISFVGIINYMIDPLWCFNHKNILNNKKVAFNEREQKTNYIYFNDKLKFDTILLGSSRTVNINQNDFINMNVYNYAVSAMVPYEYKEYINFTKQINPNLKNIIVGIDFFLGTNKLPSAKINYPRKYINNTTSFAYKYKMLFSKNLFNHSIKNIKLNLIENRKPYFNNNIKYWPRKSEKERIKSYNKWLKKNLYNLSDKNYTYNNNYLKLLQDLKNENKNINFIIFTSPITANLLVSFIKDLDRMDDYQRWLKETISVFGNIHHFMDINTITKNVQNYTDDNHYYPNIGKLIANKISGKPNSDIPDDFGIILNKDNLNEYMQKFKEKIKGY